MERSYQIAAERAAQDGPLPDVPGAEGLGGSAVELMGVQTRWWTFTEAQFPLIPAVRAAVDAAGASRTELGMRGFDPDASAAAPLARLSGGGWEGAEVVSAHVLSRTRCSGCGRGTPVLAKEPSLTLRLHDGAVPDLFWVAAAEVWVTSARFRTALEEANVAQGLRFFPVHTPGWTGEPLHGVLATVSLGRPAAPFGWTGEPCPVCGRPRVKPFREEDQRFLPGQPKYAFYPTFARPEGEPAWMTEDDAPTELLLAPPARDLLWKGRWKDARGTERGDLNLLALGWDPDERAVAFLDPALQAGGGGG